MKKLMIAAAIVCAAAMSQAATVKWSASNVYERGSTTAKAGNGYVAFFVSTADMFAADGETKIASGYSLANAKTALGKGDISFLEDYGMAPAVFAVNTSTGAGKGSSLGDTVTGNAANSQAWTGYLVILDNTSYETATYAYITDTVTKSTGANGAQAVLTFSSNTGTQTAGNWYKLETIPEPTSGLLLLLGVAGLALKRKRA